MRKSLSIVIIFAAGLILSLELKANVKCAQCGRMVQSWQSYRIDSNDVQFRRMFRQHLQSHIDTTHQMFLKENDLDKDKFMDFYLTPSGAPGDETDFYHKAINLHLKSEEEIQKKPLPESMKCFLSCDNISPQFTGILSDLEFSRFDGFKHHFRPENGTKHVCRQCDKGFFRFINARTMTPRNIQPLLKFNQIVDQSDIVILLLSGSRKYCAENLLLDYFKLFHKKKVALGVGICDDEVDFFNKNLETIKTLIEEAIIKSYKLDTSGTTFSIGDSLHYNSNTENSESGNNYPNWEHKNEVDLITKYMIPGMSFKKFKKHHPEKMNPEKARLLRFLEARCKNAFCFGAENALAYLADDFYQIATKHHELLKLICSELLIKVSSPDEVITAKKEIEDQLCYGHGYRRSKAGRTETAKRVAAYFAAINGKRNRGNRVPFIIAIDAEYGMFKIDRYYQDSLNSREKAELLQNLVRKELENLNIKKINITTIFATPWGSCPAVFSKENNPMLDMFCLDYVMFYNGLLERIYS
ncbi:hypothetical protein P0136_11140 [Lentisphaerota bacterium ZTH]|nr:hypothetical protein JYG24_11340 [Lentisphaerota bacterium]WET05914.1 hypothetical protein P0136_11140 [Lentisphaerota bacterium ZTH]